MFAYNCVVIQSLSMLLNGQLQLAELTAILDRFFIIIANTTSNYVGVEGWRWWLATKQQAKSGKTENNQMASLGTIISSTYHPKQLTPWPTSSASGQKCILLLCVCKLVLSNPITYC